MSESTKEAIRIARANGHICMINTGRTKRLVGENLTGQVEFDGLLLGCGAGRCALRAGVDIFLRHRRIFLSKRRPLRTQRHLSRPAQPQLAGVF